MRTAQDDENGVYVAGVTNWDLITGQPFNFDYWRFNKKGAKEPKP